MNKLTLRVPSKAQIMLPLLLLFLLLLRFPWLHLLRIMHRLGGWYIAGAQHSYAGASQLLREPLTILGRRWSKNIMNRIHTNRARGYCVHTFLGKHWCFPPRVCLLTPCGRSLPPGRPKAQNQIRWRNSEPASPAPRGGQRYLGMKTSAQYEDLDILHSRINTPNNDYQSS